MFHFATLPHQAGGRGAGSPPPWVKRPISPQPIHALEAHLMEPMATATSHMLRCSGGGLRGRLIANAAPQFDQGQLPLSRGCKFLIARHRSDLPIDYAKSALGAGFDGRDQPGHTLNPRVVGVGLYSRHQGDACASVLPFFFLKPPA